MHSHAGAWERYVSGIGLLEMHVLDPGGAGGTHYDIGVIDEQAGQRAGVVFERIAQARRYGDSPDNAGNQERQETQYGRGQGIFAGRFGAFVKPVGDE
jgi:hypothetical protein